MKKYMAALLIGILAAVPCGAEETSQETEWKAWENVETADLNEEEAKAALEELQGAYEILLGKYYEASGEEPEEEETEAEEDEETEYVTTANLNVRKGPSTDDEIVGKLSSGSHVTVKAVKDGWATVSYNGETAYVSASYIVKEENAPGDEGSAGQAVMPEASADMVGAYYWDIKDELQNAGFTRVKTQKEQAALPEDPSDLWMVETGDVTEISVDGKTQFEQGETFDADAQIIITWAEVS